MTISFWSNHNPAGTYSIAIRNAAATRSYVTTYTQVTAGVSQYNTVTVPGDTTGTWAVDNTIGITLSFTLASGTTFIAPAANTWSAGNYIAASGQVNGVATTAGAFHASGVTILPGSEAPSAARSPFVMRPYDQELVTCKRYWQKYSGLIISGYNAATNNIFHSITINPMRANPTMTYSNLSSSSNVNTIVATSSTPNGVGTQVLVTATGFGQTLYDLTLDARL
jgi:hypothetical protein